ncbi:MAG: hypothetical protein P8X74_00210 [Reinekea sp.]
MEALFNKKLMRNKSTLVVLAVVMLVLLMSVSRAPVQLLPQIEKNMKQNNIGCQGVKPDDKLLSNQFIRYKEGDLVRLAEATGGSRL